MLQEYQELRHFLLQGNNKQYSTDSDVSATVQKTNDD